MEGGKLIYTLGGEGSGKSIHSELNKEYISSKGVNIIRVREPGGTPVAELVRNDILLNKESKINYWSEVLGFQIARSELYEKVVIPNLERGVSVIQDRSKDCSTAYQGYGRGIDLELIKKLNKESTFGYEPDLAFIIDVDPVKGLEKELNHDRMGLAGLEFHKRARFGYLEIARENPENYVVIPYIENGVDEMQFLMRPYIDKLFNFF